MTSRAQPARRRFGRDERGVSLVELLLVLLFVGVAFTVFAAIFSSTITHNSQVAESNVLQTEVRAAVDRIARELRQAYTGDTTSPLETIDANELTFLSPDREQTFHLQRIYYRVSGHALERRVATSTDTDGAPWSFGAPTPWYQQFDSIAGTIFFKYLDANGAETLDRPSVRTIVITAVMEPKTTKGRQVTYQTSATIRASQG